MKEHPGISLQTVLGNMASHVQSMATDLAPTKFGCSPCPGMPFVDIEIKPAHGGDPYNGEGDHKGKHLGPVWDDCYILGIGVGNRCGLISAFSMICAHYIGKLYEIPTELITEPKNRNDSRANYDAGLLSDLLKICQSKE